LPPNEVFVNSSSPPGIVHLALVWSPCTASFMTDVLTYINKSGKVQSNLTEHFLRNPTHQKGFYIVLLHTVIQSFLFII